VQPVDLCAGRARHPDVAERRRGRERTPTDRHDLDDVVRRGSIRETVFEPLFGTKTVPSSAMAALSGALPTRIVATTRSRRGLIRETVFDLAFDTQTALFETATDRGAFPTKMLRSLLVRGLIL
jgi:hypothetical protein